MRRDSADGHSVIAINGEAVKMDIRSYACDNNLLYQKRLNTRRFPLYLTGHCIVLFKYAVYLLNEP